jgi:hypothetical protein
MMRKARRLLIAGSVGLASLAVVIPARAGQPPGLTGYEGQPGNQGGGGGGGLKGYEGQPGNQGGGGGGGNAPGLLGYEGQPGNQGG